MSDLKQIRSKLISYKPRRQQLYYIFHIILNQRRLSYNTCLALGYYFKCRKCRKERSLKERSSSKQDFYLNQGIKKLNRDLDIINLLEMIQIYRVMKMTVFSQDDRFFLRAQRRDMIYTSESEEDQQQPNENVMWKTAKTRSWMRNILNQDEAINKEQKESLKKLLQRYQDRKLRDEEFRILQGVLMKDFGEAEQKKKAKKMFEQEKHNLKMNATTYDKSKTPELRTLKTQKLCLQEKQLVRAKTGLSGYNNTTVVASEEILIQPRNTPPPSP